MKKWVKKIPHPSYGNYTGAKKRCDSKKNITCPLPVDEYDSFGQQHDRDGDDKAYGRKLKTLSFKSKFKRPVYGRIHWFFNKTFVFRG